jgi:uncharacterized membrane protein
MVSREEEMRKLKERYAQTRGAVVAPEKKEVPVKKVVAPRVGIKPSIIDLKKYLNIMEGDVRRLFGLKSREQIKKENTYDPLMAAWKRGRNL